MRLLLLALFPLQNSLECPRLHQVVERDCCVRSGVILGFRTLAVTKEQIVLGLGSDPWSPLIRPSVPCWRIWPQRVAKIAGPGRKRRSPDPDAVADPGALWLSTKRLKMSGGTSATGPRRGPPGLEDATSKKKQKDRANQESKDGDPRRCGNDIPMVGWVEPQL